MLGRASPKKAAVARAQGSPKAACKAAAKASARGAPKAKAKASPKAVATTKPASRPASKASPKAGDKAGLAVTKAKAKAQRGAKRKQDDMPESPVPKRARQREEQEGDDILGGDGLEELNFSMSSEKLTEQAEAILGGQSAVARNKPKCIAQMVSLDVKRVAAAVRLFEEGNTLPFIARYRKEQTQSMDENQLRHVFRALQRVDDLEQRRHKVALALHKRELLTDDLRQGLLSATVVEEVDDIWAPFKTKKETRGQLARSRGLQALAELLEQCGGARASEQPLKVAASFVNAGAGVDDASAALAGARDIVAEELAYRSAVKDLARSRLEPVALFRSERRKEADPEEQYQVYWNFEAPVRRVKPYQFLAVQRAVSVGAVKASVVVPDAPLQQLSQNIVALCRRTEAAHAAAGGRCAQQWVKQLHDATSDSLKRLIRPSLEREWKRCMKDMSEDDAFDTYRRNLHAKLLTQPLRLHPEWGEAALQQPPAVLGIDPAYRTGCKLALIAPTGELLRTDTVYPHAQADHNQRTLASATLRACLDAGFAAAGAREGKKAPRQPSQRRASSCPPSVVCSIGNGTASRETESWLRSELLAAKAADNAAPLAGHVTYCVVDESGASVYSASPLAGKELPNQDVSLRGAVSIARRLQDPLAELVKIDPQSLGVGLYQHDVSKKRLTSELRGAVEDCVNAVGVDLNTASPSLLEHVAGLTSSLASRLVDHRSSSGPFSRRQDLLQVKGLGKKTFQQAAGFMRVYGGSEPLDETGIHPESYKVARSLKSKLANASFALESSALQETAVELGVGVETMSDILAALSGSAKDPRLKQPPLRVKAPGCTSSSRCADAAIDAQEAGITVEDLKPNMLLEGVVRNVVAFGAFIDIGVGHDALLHKSAYPDSARGQVDAFSVNDRVEVWIANATCMGAGAGRGGKAGKGKKENWRIGVTLRPPSERASG